MSISHLTVVRLCTSVSYCCLVQFHEDNNVYFTLNCGTFMSSVQLQKVQTYHFKDKAHSVVRVNTHPSCERAVTHSLCLKSSFFVLYDMFCKQADLSVHIAVCICSFCC